MYDERHNPTQGKPNMPDKLLSSHKPVNLLRLDRVTTARLARDGELPAPRAFSVTRGGEHCPGLPGSAEDPAYLWTRQGLT